MILKVRAEVESEKYTEGKKPKAVINSKTTNFKTNDISKCKSSNSLKVLKIKIYEIIGL